jgi:stage V sporulation protein D (sporulation-specific penicillin-binding protein)
MIIWSLMFIGAIIVSRLFYIQIIKGGDYKRLARSEHNKKFEIPAKRGEILANDGDQTVPLVLNEPAYVIFADPRYVEDKEKTAEKLSVILSESKQSIESKLRINGAYSVIASRADAKTKDKIKKLKLKGVGSSQVSKRVYTEGNLAAQALGFVNNDGAGQYGVEQAFNKQLSGQAGQLDGATDIRGVPIATEGSILKSPENGDSLVLSLDLSIQVQAEYFLEAGIKRTNADNGSIVIMNPDNGKIIAMANYPTFDPDNYSKQKDVGVFQNNVVSGAYEPGSVAKIFTMSTALEKGVVRPDTTYLDNSIRVIDDYKIRNTGPQITKQRSMTDVITRSANTGTIFALEQLGGGDINLKAKQQLYDSFTQRFKFGQKTGVEQTGEAGGIVGEPKQSSDVRYANMSFGQGVSMTMMQLAAATSSIANGGVYYKPTIIDKIKHSDGSIMQNQPKIVEKEVLSAKTIKEIKDMMRTVVGPEGSGYQAILPGYDIAGKTGTAEVAKPDGGYYKDREIGSFFGFTPTDSPKYVIMVRVDRPKQSDVFASRAAVGIFADMNKWLIDYYGIAPSR